MPCYNPTYLIEIGDQAHVHGQQVAVHTIRAQPAVCTDEAVLPRRCRSQQLRKQVWHELHSW